MPRRGQPIPLEVFLGVLERTAPRPLTLREIAERAGFEHFDPRALTAALEEQVRDRRLRRIGKTRYQWSEPTRIERRHPPAPHGAAGGESEAERGVGPFGERAARHGRAGAERPRRFDQRSPRDTAGERRAPRPFGPRERAGEGGRVPFTARERAGEGGRAPFTARERVAGGGRDPFAARERAFDGARRTAAPAIEGRYSRTRTGFAFVVPGAAHGPMRDVFIPDGLEGDALHGDGVRVEIIRRDARGERIAGRIVEVLRRANERIVGMLELEPSRRRAPRAARRAASGEGASAPSARWRLVPQSDLLPAIEVIGGIAPSAFDAGKLAVLRLTRPSDPRRGPGGELERVLGDADDPEVQFLTIALEHGLRTEFPPEARAEAAALPADPAAGEVAGREDLRHLPFVTIDGESARDFDDAVCVEVLEGGERRLWVAIADVSSAVPAGSALDREAAARGTSVYFPDRAIPMLPEELSSELCSLKPDRDRLVLVAEMVLDKRGARREPRFYRAVIRSRARLTYTQVAAVLSQTDTEALRRQREELGDLVPRLQQMRDLMRVLLRRRIAAGSLDLDLPEALVDLSEEGRSIGVRTAPRNDAHRLIEEMMLEANQAVAIFLRDRGVPFPYRVHEPPEPADVDELNELLGAFGAHVEYGDVVRPADVQRALKALEGHRLARVLSRQVLRALKQAHYSPANAGHFGLAFPTYCHFTSPIRRYPDLLVHRQLCAVLDGDVANAVARADQIAAESVASSEAERRAMEAERAMLDLKKAEFMLDHLLEPEPAVVVSVAKYGLFVELEAAPIEGLLPVSAIPGRYRYDPQSQALVASERSGARFRLGDRLSVEATSVSLRRRQVTFAFLERLGPQAEPAKRERRGKKPRGSKRGG